MCLKCNKSPIRIFFGRIQNHLKKKWCISEWILPPPQLSVHTHKVLPDIVEVFAVFLQRLLEQVCLWWAPLLHLIPAQHGPSLRNEHAQSAGQIITVPMQGVHSMKLKENQIGKELIRLYTSPVDMPRQMVLMGWVPVWCLVRLLRHSCVSWAVWRSCCSPKLEQKYQPLCTQITRFIMQIWWKKWHSFQYLLQQWFSTGRSQPKKRVAYKNDPIVWCKFINRAGHQYRFYSNS